MLNGELCAGITFVYKFRVAGKFRMREEGTRASLSVHCSVSHCYEISSFWFWRVRFRPSFPLERYRISKLGGDGVFVYIRSSKVLYLDGDRNNRDGPLQLTFSGVCRNFCESRALCWDSDRRSPIRIRYGLWDVRKLILILWKVRLNSCDFEFNYALYNVLIFFT